MEDIVPMRVDTGYCYRKNDQIIYKDLGGAPVLIDPYRRTLVQLNPTAHKIWLLLDGERPVTAIIEVLNAEFEIDPGKLEQDISSFLKELVRREMIG
jgi:hypothetical protein